ncbi:MAG: NYN domain-containing protein [Actinobacteria bacterium]|nr:NYN domain-containing protein [Actinomycetota bacterium]
MQALVVDGYNVMHASPRYLDIADRDIDAARAVIVNDIAAYAHDQFEAIVVFDGATNPYSDGTPHEVAGVQVIFSPWGRDADGVIEQEIARRHAQGQQVVLVTSDAQTQWVGLGLDALRVSSAQFVERLIASAEEDRGFLPAGSPGATLDARIDPATRDALAKWARGL